MRSTAITPTKASNKSKQKQHLLTNGKSENDEKDEYSTTITGGYNNKKSN